MKWREKRIKTMESRAVKQLQASGPCSVHCFPSDWRGSLLQQAPEEGQASLIPGSCSAQCSQHSVASIFSQFSLSRFIVEYP